MPFPPLPLTRAAIAWLPLLILLASRTPATETKPLEFHISFAKTVSSRPFTGRVYVMLSRQAITEPRSGPSWFNTEPFYAGDVKEWKPGQDLVLGRDALGFPVPLAKLAKASYWVQAVMDFDRGDRSFWAAVGNGYSKASQFELDPATSGSVQLVIDQIVQPRPFKETDRVKLVDMESKLLSTFYDRPVRMRAGVILPKSFEENPANRYPVIYVIPGFGGTHAGVHFAALQNPTDVAGVEMLYVVLDPACRWGHHVFADSENNGPRGQALIGELIPHIEKQFHALGLPEARFVTGHSSGGWSSLWLQVTYPDFFGGVWSTSPDPVDFRDFQRINIYKPGTNMFVDESGDPRPLARRSGKPVLFYKPFSDMEVVMGHGGQLQSFEAVFSPRCADGRPKQLWNRATGAIDPEVAKHWERYDLRLVLERNWKTLGPKLAGKLHVFMGAKDTFYLEGATRLLKESLSRLGSDAVVEILPGRDHSNLVDRALRERIAKEMTEQCRRNCPAAK
jgi:enterochelin esterase-like enzyme